MGFNVTAHHIQIGMLVVAAMLGVTAWLVRDREGFGDGTFIAQGCAVVFALFLAVAAFGWYVIGGMFA